MSFNFSVKVFPVRNSSSSLKAFASVIIEDVLEIKGFKIFEGKRGLFVSLPSTKSTDRDGNEKWFKDVVFHEEPEEGYRGRVQLEIEDAILAEYKAATQNNKRSSTAEARYSHQKSNRGNKSRSRLPFDDPAW